MNDYETKKAEIQEALIAIVEDQVEVNTDFLRFWKPEERMGEDQMFEKYQTIYSVDVVFEYGKSTKFPVIKTYVERNYQRFDANSAIGVVFIGIDPLVIAELRSWSRNAARTLDTYFQNTECYFIKKIRFDFLPVDTNANSFIIPYIPLEEITLSTKRRGKPYQFEDYIKDKVESDKALEMLKKTFQEKSSS